MTFRIRAFLAIAIAICAAAQTAPPAHKVLVLSVDGLDWRYLRDRDKFGLKIPHLRRLLKEGRYSNGVIGVNPTITWPSHTTIITGVTPDQHGIRGNRRPQAEGGEYYWSANLLKARTLWHAVHDRGWTSAAITWPVTVDAAITYNLPEFFLGRNGGSMDLKAIASKATPGLVDEIAKAYPSFAQQWMDDRTRTLALLYLLRSKQPDFLLVHLVDLDSEQHDQGPFDRNAFAILERTDELIGQIVDALPARYVLALVSDHGFARVDHDANLPVLLSQKGIAGQVRAQGGVATTADEKVAAFLREAAKSPGNGIGREIPHEELVRFAPALRDAVAAFEPADGFMFGSASSPPYLTAPREKGNHGFWPLRSDYRSVFLVRGPGIMAGQEPEMEMTQIAGRLATLLGMKFP